jgi:hypothetical protein
VKVGILSLSAAGCALSEPCSGAAVVPGPRNLVVGVSGTYCSIFVSHLVVCVEGREF